MLKKRIIPVQLLLASGRLVKTLRFDSWRDVGDPVASSRVYNAQLADELVFLNIDRERRTIDVLLPLLERVSEVCFMPLALGGGIRSARDAEVLIRHGADKVIVNSEVYRTPEIVSEIARTFGNQAVIVSIDARWDEASLSYVVSSNCGRTTEPISLRKHVARAVELGAGEIFINSIDRDGTMTGYDGALIREVVAAAGTVPVIACGGAGTYEHMRDAFVETGVNALACGSLFNFGDNNPIRAKAFLSNHGLSFKVV
ncbi:MAG: imidazole glycerol phosphate synthase subunit HisF [Myxococcales bacterium]|nr:imidazole glycerol phosphate synthase subunit HisF [Myxococcales bacterium]